MNQIEDQTSEALASLVRHPHAIGQLPGYLQQQIVEDPIGTLARLMEPSSRYTQLISGTEILTIDPTDGSKIIADVRGIFAKTGIDRDFVNWGCNVPSSATLKQNVVVHELIEGGNFAQIFDSLSPDRDSLCLTQAQIIQSILHHKKWLRTEGYSTFFLFKKGSEFFVADVRVYSGDELNVYLRRFSNNFVWDATMRHRIIIPQDLM